MAPAGGGRRRLPSRAAAAPAAAGIPWMATALGSLLAWRAGHDRIRTRPQESGRRLGRDPVGGQQRQDPAKALEAADRIILLEIPAARKAPSPPRMRGFPSRCAWRFSAEKKPGS